MIDTKLRWLMRMRGGELVVEALQVGEQSLVTAGSSEETQSGLVARANGRLVEESVSSRPACSDSGLRDMPVLKVLCPNRKRPFSTGVDIRVEEKASLPNIRNSRSAPIARWRTAGHLKKPFLTIRQRLFFGLSELGARR